jgi:GTPase SAR1 family protein
MKMDVEHGNDVVLLLMGDQGCGKSTFCQRLLPTNLRE